MAKNRPIEDSCIRPVAEHSAVMLWLGRLPVDLGRSARRVAGRHWLVRRLSVLAGRDLPVSELVYSANGKPEVKGLDWGFSYANCGRFVVLAAAPGSCRLGVDLEPMNPRPSWLSLARRYFAADEMDALRGIMNPDYRRQAFYALWTAKEARVKYAGGRLWPTLADSVMSQAAGGSGGAPRWWWHAGNNLMLCLWGGVADKPVRWHLSAGDGWQVWRWPL